MRHQDTWARKWPNVVPSVRHVEVLALKNAWRAEALDKRFRIEAALELHRERDDGQCETCLLPAPCATYIALTTPTPWKHTAQGRPVTLPIGIGNVQAAIAELLTAPAEAGDATKKIQPQQAC
ncbi:hypothetical protein ACWEDZ_32305 [Streptomyces sp. NPDC005047]